MTDQRRSFDEIWETAVSRKGLEVLEERMPTPTDPDDLIHFGDDRWLSTITSHVFSAGFRWKVIEAKWDGFEEAFVHFDPATVAAFDDGRIEELGKDTRIVRNNQKIVATVANAKYVRDIAAEHGSFGQFVADWPEDDIVGLWQELAKNGSRLGGATGPRTLRAVGKDTFLLTPDVVHSLTEQGVLTGKATSKTQQKRAQDAFLAWREESGRPMSQISVVIACATDRPE